MSRIKCADDRFHASLRFHQMHLTVVRAGRSVPVEIGRLDWGFRHQRALRMHSRATTVRLGRHELLPLFRIHTRVAFRSDWCGARACFEAVFANTSRTRGITVDADVNGWRAVQRPRRKPVRPPIRNNFACQANFAAPLLTRSSRLSILAPLLVPVHREQISEMNAERCGR